MKLFCLFSLLMAGAAFAEAETPPIFSNDFSREAVGQLPKDFLAIAGDFTVMEDDRDGRFLVLPGAPLESFGLLFGPTLKGESGVRARFFGTKAGRKFPAFGLSLGGVGGYRLQVSGNKKRLEIVQGDAVRQSVEYLWNEGGWTNLLLQVRKVGSEWVIEGKVWPSGGVEPVGWMISLSTPLEPPGGRPGLWGTPYSGTPIRFDDLLVIPGGLVIK